MNSCSFDHILLSGWELLPVTLTLALVFLTAPSPPDTINRLIWTRIRSLANPFRITRFSANWARVVWAWCMKPKTPSSAAA